MIASTGSTTVGPILTVTPGRSSAPEAINFSRNAFACSTDENSARIKTPFRIVDAAQHHVPRRHLLPPRRIGVGVFERAIILQPIPACNLSAVGGVPRVPQSFIDMNRTIGLVRLAVSSPENT